MLLEIFWEKDKMLVTIIFSFSHYPLKQKFQVLENQFMSSTHAHISDKAIILMSGIELSILF